MDDIIICTWERSWLLTDTQSFIDIVNLKTEKKQRVFTSEVNLIYSEKDKIIVNAKIWDTFKTLKLNINTLEIIEEIEEEFQAFFKCVYNTTSLKWFILDFQKTWEWWNEGYFNLKEVDVEWEPKTFNRQEYKVNGNIDIWELSCK